MPTIYAAGDTAVHADMGLIGELYTPSIAILPIGDHYTMGPCQAAYAARLIGAPEIVPGHYGTFGLLTGTPEALRDELARIGVSATVHEVQPGRGRASLRVTFSIVACDAARAADGRRGGIEVPGRRRRRAVARGRGRRDRDAGAREHALRAGRPRAPARGRRAPARRSTPCWPADPGPRRPPGRHRRRARPRRDAHRAELHGLGGRPHRPRLRRAGQHPHRARRRRRDGRELRVEQRARSPTGCCWRSRPAMPQAATGAAGSRPRSPSSRPSGGYGGNDDRLVDLRVGRPPGPGGRAAAPVRHPRAAERHDAGGAEAAARR